MRMTPSVLAAAAVWILSLATATAQSGTDGATLQNVGGIALVKPQAWSKETEATLVEFKAYIDRSATGHGTAGYYEFHLPSGQTRQYPVSKVFGVVIYPDPERVQNLVTSDDRSKIEKTIAEVQSVITRFPATKGYLEPRIQNFATLLTSYDSGQVKSEGKWIQRQRYTEGEASRLADILKIEITQAKPPGSMNLEEDPKFIALVAMGKSAAKAKLFVNELRDIQGRLARGERRKKIMEKLADPALPLPACQELVVELNTLQPSEDPASKAAVVRWQNSLKEAARLADTAKPLAEKLNAELSSIVDFAKAPTFSSESSDAATKLAAEVKKFQASSPPPQFTAEVAQAAAVAAVYDGMLKVGPLLEANQFLEVKDVLDSLSQRTALVGSHASRANGELQRIAAARIEIFTRAREDAKALADAGKGPEAIAKYQEAFSVIPDPSVGSAIEQLKTATAKP